MMQMWAELGDRGSRLGRLGPAPTDDEVVDRLRQIDGEVSSRALLAAVEGEPVGMTILTAAPTSPLCDQIAVHVHYLYVRAGWRRRGAASALLAAAAAFADEVGAEHVTTSAPSQLRDTNRFLARLGFAPVVVRRSVPVVVLRRRLASVRPALASDHVLAQRRSLKRLRAAVGASGWGPVSAADGSNQAGESRGADAAAALVADDDLVRRDS